MPINKTNLSLPEAITELREEAERLRAAPDQQELTDISSDDAFILGYESATHDLDRITQPPQAEVGIIRYFQKDEGADDGSR